MKRTVVIVSQDMVLINGVEHTMENLYKTAVFSAIQSALDYIYNSLPDLVIVDLEEQNTFTLHILTTLKTDPLFRQLPILAVVPHNFIETTREIPPFEDFIYKSDLGRDLFSRIRLCISRAERIVEINPLTRLPGNISINRHIQDTLNSTALFGLAYADLDYFKPFNDKYGFSRGDDVIRILGRIILNIVKNSQPHLSFVGHIGGDDFIFLMDTELIEAAAAEIIDTFDKIIPTFYDTDDRETGFIRSTDRQGNATRFDLMSLSIGITDNVLRHFSHYGEMTERASEMKKYAKQFEGSCYKVDRRKNSKPSAL